MSVEDKNEGSNKEERIDERVGPDPEAKVEAALDLDASGLKNEPTVSDETRDKAKAKVRARKPKEDAEKVAAEEVAKAAYRAALFQGTPPDYPWAGRSESWRKAVQVELLADSAPEAKVESPGPEL